MCKFKCTDKNLCIPPPPAGHVCCLLSLCPQHTQRSPMIPRGMDEQNNGRMARLLKDKIKINKLLFHPTFLALRFIHVLLHCGRLQSLCLYLVWSCLKPLASSQHSVRVCVYVGGCVCVSVFFPSLQMMEAQGSPCFNTALSLPSLGISGLLEHHISVSIYSLSCLYRYFFE